MTLGGGSFSSGGFYLGGGFFTLMKFLALMAVFYLSVNQLSDLDQG